MSTPAVANMRSKHPRFGTRLYVRRPGCGGFILMNSRIVLCVLHMRAASRYRYNVKFHRGNRDTQGSKQTNLTTIPTHQRTRTNARRPNPRPTQQPQPAVQQPWSRPLPAAVCFRMSKHVIKRAHFLFGITFGDRWRLGLSWSTQTNVGSVGRRDRHCSWKLGCGKRLRPSLSWSGSWAALPARWL